MTTSQDKLRFGICGLGFMGRTYFQHLRAHPAACVTALCDRDPSRRAGEWSQSTGNIAGAAAGATDLTGLAAYSTPEELARDPHVDVVAITLPTPLHEPVTCAALAAGKHVLCEKPMALDLLACDRMIRAARKARRTLMIGQCVRFWPQYERIKALVDQGHIGRVRFTKLTRIASPPGYSEHNWLMDGGQSGGALFDLHVHDVDFTHYLLGVPDRIYARGHRGPSGEIDHVFAAYEYSGGPTAWVEGGWTYHAPWPFEMSITVAGETGTLDWSSRRGRDVLCFRGGPDADQIHCGDATGWAAELDYLIECITAGRVVRRCLPESSRKSIALTLLERRAIETGRPVAVPRGLRRGQ